MDWHEAQFYQTLENGDVVCRLCPHACRLADGQRGRCRVRHNRGGRLYSANYGFVSSLAVDPIEKKPLYHFFPGRQIVSVGSVGCNLQCFFCQNYSISQVCESENDYGRRMSCSEIVEYALQQVDNLGIAYTYNEPSVWAEFMLDTAQLAAARGLRNVMVTNGYILGSPLEQILSVVDAFNVDLKGFSERFYADGTGASLKPVLRTIARIAKSGRHLELTNLIVPSLNDRPEAFTDMVKWISQETGPDTVLHLSRYYPRYKATHSPTPEPVLTALREIALKHLSFVYLGNVATTEGSNTYCPVCSSLAISRQGYRLTFHAYEAGRCTQCGHILCVDSERQPVK